VCLAAALLFVLSVDIFLTQMGVSTSFFTILGHGPPSPRAPPGTIAPDSTVSFYLGGWVALTIVIAMIRSFLSGDLHKWNLVLTGGYYRLPSADDSAEPSKKNRRSAPQRTFSYPDTLEFNYFDPDALPKSVQVYSDHIFSAVQALSAEIGFQVRVVHGDVVANLMRGQSGNRWIIRETKPSTC
jgi:hypothetical protein